MIARPKHRADVPVDAPSLETHSLGFHLAWANWYCRACADYQPRHRAEAS